MRGGGANREKGRLALAWMSYILAACAGAAAVGTFIGSWIAGITNWLPFNGGIVLFLVLLIGMGVDMFIDGEPNRVALYSVMLLPSVASGLPGKLAASVGEGSTRLLTAVNQILGEWVGTAAGVGAVLVLGVSAHFMARRVVAKGGGGGGR